MPPAPPKPAALDPRLCAEVRATPVKPAGASFVQPATIEQRLATSLGLGWIADLVDVADENEGKARLAKAECERRR